jgi:hypothetical protein
LGKPGGVGKLEWGGNGEGEVSLRATWGQGGRDRTTQEEGFQVSKKGFKGLSEWQGELTGEVSKGSKNWELRHNLVLLIYACVYDDRINAANKRIVFRL